MATEPTIVCPKCRADIKLTESLAAPLLESARRESAEKLRQERAVIEAEAQKKAKLVVAADLDEKLCEIATLKEVARARDAKLAESQKVQAELLREKIALDEQKRELELTIATRVQAGLSGVREAAQREAAEEHRLKALEKEQQLAALQRQIEELKRRAEQGSQQLQGEVQELELEALLKSRFPGDSIEPVAKGEHGGDALQRVCGPLGQACGAILWESKRTKNWSDGWLAKLRDDQRAAGAIISVIVSQALPKGVDAFEWIGDVWVVHPRFAIPLAVALRNSLLEVASARRSLEGQETKKGRIYDYVTGPRFRQKVQAIAEAFSSMQEDLFREKRAIEKLWSKRQEQIERLILATSRMAGELEGVAGAPLLAIEGLDLPGLGAPKVEEKVDEA